MQHRISASLTGRALAWCTLLSSVAVAALSGCAANDPHEVISTQAPDQAAAERFAAQVAKTFQAASADRHQTYSELDFTQVISANSERFRAVDPDGTFEDMVPGKSLTVDAHLCTVVIDFEPTEVGTAPTVKEANCN